MIVRDVGRLAIGERALRWIAGHADRLTPSLGRALPPQLVALGELGLLVHLIARSAKPDRDALGKCRAALAGAYAPQTFEDGLRDDMPTMLNAWLTVLLGLGKRARARLPQIDDPNTFARERLPHRTLELCWLLEALAWPSPHAPSIGEVYRTTYLARPHAIGGASPADCYAVTHAIAYVTDFGARRFFDDATARTVAADAGAILARALEWENYDLVAEALAALRWLNVPLDAGQERAWQSLGRRQLQSGAVPGVAGEIAEDEPSLFPLFYHPTLVTVLAALD